MKERHTAAKVQKRREGFHQEELFIEFAVDAFFHIGADEKIKRVNDKACQLTGYSRQELIGAPVSTLFSKEELLANPLQYHRLKGEESIIKERTITRRDGLKVPVEMNSKLLPDGTLQSYFRDITDRKRELQALQSSELRYRDLHASMLDGFISVDMAGRVIDTNRSLQEMLGYTAEELKQLTYRDLTPERWHKFESEIVAEQIMTRGHSDVYEKEYRRKDGSVFPIELRTLTTVGDDGKYNGMWAIIRDITIRKKAEEALRESEERFRTIVESSLIAMYFYRLGNDDQLILTGANPAADRIIGISHKDLIGKTMLEAFPNLEGTDIPAIYLKVAKGELHHHSFEIAYSDPRISGHYQVDVFSTGPGIITVEFFDITQRVRSAEQKEILLREIHHRVKNNMAIIISLLNFQLRKSNTPKLSGMIRDIQLRIRSMALIHEHLYRSENLDRIPLADYIQSLAAIILSAFSGAHVELKTDLDPVDVNIETALPIGLIINELLTNAFKYAFDGIEKGKITLTLRKEAGDLCVFEVSDNGKGLPEDFALTSDNTLGMYIVRLLTEQLDGTTTYFSNQGATFRITFHNLLLQGSIQQNH